MIPEFYRDLSQDPQMKALWHYVFRTNGDRKPIKTPNGKPHKLDFTWKDMFPNENGHIEVEIGSGKGNFMTDYAEKHPDYFIMGSEWDFTWAAFAHERMEKRGIVAQGNAAMLRGDVFYFLRDANATTRTACSAPTSSMKSHVALSRASAFSTGVPTTRNTTKSPLKHSMPIRLARCSSAIRQNPPKASRPASNASTAKKADLFTEVLLSLRSRI